MAPGGEIREVDLPGPRRTTGSEGVPGGVEFRSEAVARAERDAILAALERTGDNKARAARLLGISVRTLFYKIEKLGLR